MSDDAAPAPKARRLPFKPTALRKSTSNDAKPTSTPDNNGVDSKDDEKDDSLSLFRRAKEMAPLRAAEMEKRLRRMERRKEELQRRESGSKRALEAEEAVDALLQTQESLPVDDAAVSDHTVEDEAPPPTAVTPPSKRSRTDDTNFGSSYKPIDLSDNEAPSPSTRTLRSQPTRPIPPSTQIISLDSDSEPDIQITPLPPLTRPRSPSLELATTQASDDDDFSEYIRKAASQRERELAASQASTSSSAAQPSHPIVEIIITSSIANTEKLLVKFRFDKPIRLIRDTWVALQRKKGIPLPIASDNDIILTWRRKKAYPYSTLRDLGVLPDGYGGVIVEGYSNDGLSNSRTRVHFEAWTTSLFEEMEHEEELRRKREAGELSEEEEDIYSAPVEEEPEDVKLRIILQPRELEAVKLNVRPETNVVTLIAAFKSQRTVPDGAEVALWFDGEKMADEMTMEEADIDDMDSIEVHIK